MEVPKEIEEQYVNENWTKEELIEALDDKIWDCLDTYEIDDIVVN